MKAIACERVTLGNEFRNTSRLSAASKWSSRAWTGTLVPLKTGVPLNTWDERLTTCAAVFATDTVSFYLVSLWHWTEGCPPYLQTSKGCVNQLALRQKPVTSPVPTPHPCGRIFVCFRVCFYGRDLPGMMLPLFALVDVLGEIDADAHFFDHAELGFEPIDMLFFVDEDLFE